MKYPVLAIVIYLLYKLVQANVKMSNNKNFPNCASYIMRTQDAWHLLPLGFITINAIIFLAPIKYYLYHIALITKSYCTN